MANFGALQTRVLNNLIDTPPSVVANVPDFIQAAIDAIVAIHPSFQCMEAEWQADTTEGKHFLGQLPELWLGPRGNPYYILQIGSSRELDWLPNRQLAYRMWNPTDPNEKGPPRNLLLTSFDGTDGPATPATLTGATASGSPTLASLSADPEGSGWAVGMNIAGTGIPTGSTIINMSDGNLDEEPFVVISSPCTASGTGITFTVTAAAVPGYTRCTEVYPYPDGNSGWTSSPVGEYRIHVPYWTRLPALLNSTDTNWFTDNGTEFIVHHASAMGFFQNEDEQRAAIWSAQAWGPKFDGTDERAIGGYARRLINLDKAPGFNPSKVLAPRRDVYAPRDQWRT